MADTDDVNSTRRLLTVLGGALPLAYASLAALPQSATAADSKSTAAKNQDAAAPQAASETLPPPVEY
jgi:hypothetical protein